MLNPCPLDLVGAPVPSMCLTGCMDPSTLPVSPSVVGLKALIVLHFSFTTTLSGERAGVWGVWASCGQLAMFGRGRCCPSAHACVQGVPPASAVGRGLPYPVRRWTQLRDLAP